MDCVILCRRTGPRQLQAPRCKQPLQTGEPKLNELRAQAAEQQIEEVGKELRGLMRQETASVES